VIRKTLMFASLATVALAASAEARDQIRIAGSSTVYPFTTLVAEEFGRQTGYPTPLVESTGTGGGFKLFCAGLGVDTTDFSNASRAIKKSEMEACAKNGVTDITEMKVGYDGIVIANSKSSAQAAFTKEQLFLALAKTVPVNGELVPNPYQKWSEIDPSLPDEKIEVLGPPPTSGTRDAFLELVMEHGAESFPEVKALDKDAFKQVAFALREDGGYIDAGENDNLIVQKLVATPTAFGIFGYSFLEENLDKLNGSKVNGVGPSFEAIASGDYSVSRPLFVYIKNAHVSVIPGMKEFLTEYTSDAAWGDEGYLADHGLIPMDESERAKVKERVENLIPLTM